jgi:hypothetical protein
MKKILMLIMVMALTLCCSCEQKSSQEKAREDYKFWSKTCQDHAKLFELSFPDEHGEKRTHQFVMVHNSDCMNGITHWPDCKYCKERGL